MICCEDGERRGNSAIVGHATEAMSRHYSHVDEREKLDAARAAFGDVIATGE
jgi:hypothetical protein